MRRGFTLIEMLVASMVFITGFVAVFTLFLAGTKLRAQGDLDTRAAMAIRNLTEEIQLDAGREASTAIIMPLDYIGRGFPTSAEGETEPPEAKLEDEFFSCPGLPGMFYRVVEATDGVGDVVGKNPILNLRVIIVGYATTPPLTWGDLDRRLGINSEANAPKVTGDETTPAAVNPVFKTPSMAYLVRELVRRGIATDNRVSIIRQPSWLK